MGKLNIYYQNWMKHKVEYFKMSPHEYGIPQQRDEFILSVLEMIYVNKGEQNINYQRTNKHKF